MKRPSASMIVALLALSLAVVGTATATNAFEKDAGSAKKKKAKRGPAGPQGPAGAAGAAGAAGSPAASMLTGRTSTDLPSAAGTLFLEPNGSSIPAATEVDQKQMTPNVAIVARDLSIHIDVSGGISASKTFTLMVNGAPTALTCSIDGIGNNCNSGGTTASIAANSLISLRMANANVTNATAMEFAWRAVAP